MIKEGVVLVFLGISTWTDLRKRQVSLIITGLFAAAGLGWMLYQGAPGNVFPGIKCSYRRNFGNG